MKENVTKCRTYLIVGHPGEALGDERGEDAPEQRRCEGRDDHGRPEHSLDGGLSRKKVRKIHVT